MLRTLQLFSKISSLSETAFIITAPRSLLLAVPRRVRLSLSPSSSHFLLVEYLSRIVLLLRIKTPHLAFVESQATGTHFPILLVCVLPKAIAAPLPPLYALFDRPTTPRVCCAAVVF